MSPAHVPTVTAGGPIKNSSIAILAVPTAVAGIYGMNFKYMPELEWSFGYPACLLLMLAICRTLYYCFRRAAWL